MHAIAVRERLSPAVRLAGAWGLLALAGMIDPASALPVSDRRPVDPAGELRLRMDAGRLVARPGTEAAIAVEADLPPGMALRWREVRGGWALVVDDRERLLPREARVNLTVPPGLRLRIDAGDAGVDLEGVGGAGLVVRAGRSPVRIASANSGPITAETTGGDLRFELERPGRIRAATLGGEMDIRATVLVEADVRLETLSGGISLRVPVGGPATIRPRLARGLLTLPEAATATPDGRVRLGEGAGRVDIGSLAGDAALIEDAGLVPPPSPPPPPPPPAGTTPAPVAGAPAPPGG